MSSCPARSVLSSTAGCCVPRVLRSVVPPGACPSPVRSAGRAPRLAWRWSLLWEAPSSRCTSLAPHWTRLSFSSSDVRSLRSSSHRHHESESRSRTSRPPPPVRSPLSLLLSLLTAARPPPAGSPGATICASVAQSPRTAGPFIHFMFVWFLPRKRFKTENNHQVKSPSPGRL